ncbi:TetR/AcrR family transcriptional regulator [Mycolicibacterium sp. XJ1819]
MTTAQRSAEERGDDTFLGRGRPRDPTIEERVLEASRDELSERGFEGYSVRSVARRSGVSRPSLVLRWPDRDTLILETLEHLAEWPTPNPAADLRQELEAIVARVVELLNPTVLGIQMRLVADAPRHPKLFAAFQDTVMARASMQLTTLLNQAVADGQLRADMDVDWAADALIGAVFMRIVRKFGKGSLTANAQRRIVDSLLETFGYQPKGN